MTLNVHDWAHAVLMWVGFGTVVGLLAKLFVPGRDQGGALATLLMGVGGTIVGLGTVAYFWEGVHVTPLSVVGFAAAMGGSMLLLLVHRMLQGSFFRERGTEPQVPHHRKRASVVVRS